MKHCNALALCLVLCGLSLPTVQALDKAGSNQGCFVSASALFPGGVVVERVTSNTQAHREDMRAGDVLLCWTYGKSKGQIGSPFDLLQIEMEEASRGVVKIEGLRGKKRQSWFLGSEPWRIWTRPNLPPTLLTAYNEGRQLANANRVPEAVERWRNAASGESTPTWLRPWFLWRSAQWLQFAQQWDSAEGFFLDAIQQALDAGPIVRAMLFQELARAYVERNNMPKAANYHQAALLERRSLGLQTMAISSSLMELGFVSMQQGEFAKAEDYFQQALVIAEQLAPHSRQMVQTLHNMGVLSRDQGDLGKAEEYYRRAFAVEKQFFSGSEDLALTLSNLGILAHYRGDFTRAEVYHRQALAVAKKLDSDRLLIATILDYLGQCLLEQGEFTKSERYLKRSLLAREKLDPGSLSVASSLANLGRVARVQGNLAEAQKYDSQALAIAEKLDPSSYQLTAILMDIGDVARAEQDFSRAEQYYRRALGIFDRSSPGSQNQAETFADLAATLRNQGRLDLSVEMYRRALNIFDGHAAVLGGVGEDRFRYRARYSRYYAEYIDLLLERGEPKVAFEMLESSRARTLLETLSQARVDIRHGADPTLLDAEHRLKQLVNERSQQRIKVLSSSHTREQLADLDAELGDLSAKYQQVEADIRTSSPSYAELTQPQSLGVREIQKLLGADTILLEYSLGKEHSHVWAVSENSLTAYELPKRAEIERAARRVYQILTVRMHGTDPSAEIGSSVPIEVATKARWARADRDYPKAAAELSQLILGPVAPLLQHKRLLIVSEGALQYIPFAALPTPAVTHPERVSNVIAGNRKGSIGDPLFVAHEIVSLPSATVVAELRRQALGRRRGEKIVAVLADAVFDEQDRRVETSEWSRRQKLRKVSLEAPLSFDHLTRSATEIGLASGDRLFLPRLLYTRREANDILAVTPVGKGMKAVDFEASRAMAMSPALGQYRIVHFATHGILNNEHPEWSGLVFSMVNKQGKPQNGFLELQDIYNLNLPVELVVLSGCSTGLGKEISGEGLIGLTRGFMYAGATRVMASLWSVDDMATSELMAKFYEAMERDKLRPAAALRAAQLQMWKQRIWHSPYYWAAFQLQGEWN